MDNQLFLQRGGQSPIFNSGVDNQVFLTEVFFLQRGGKCFFTEGWTINRGLDNNVFLQSGGQSSFF